MRSHLINQSETNSRKNNKNRKKISCMSNENPRKIVKLSESSSTEKSGNDTLLHHTQSRVCRECGKSFCSWKALFGHMKCHSGRIAFHPGIESDSWNSVVDEQEEVALSLIMLSSNRISDSISACSEDSKSKKHRNENLKNPRNYSLDCENKKRFFECCSCYKTFNSYQALGGHRASHKRGKGCDNICEQNPSPNQTADNNKDNLELLAEEKVETSKKHIKDHECPICFKIFTSGQALGGHKRSHLISEAKRDQTAVTESRSFLDLNLPAPTEDDGEGSHHSVGFQAWWMMETTTHKHEQLVGPTF